ncbi:MAG: hypothetical protein ACT4OM_11950 [Actinomycetota bacterium]
MVGDRGGNFGLKDKFGFSWQVVPVQWEEMMANGTKDQMAKLTEALLQMRKLNLAELEKAYDG